jgi:putative oxidoreductase
MTTHVEMAPPTPSARAAELSAPRIRSLRFLVPIGRALFAAIFLLAAPFHFSPIAAHYAAAQGVPQAGLLVPLTGVLALAGGLSVLFGYRTRVGAALLVLFLVPITLTMHRFWGLADPQLANLQRVMFLKNTAMLGGALLLVYFGGGPGSLDGRLRQRRGSSVGSPPGMPAAG